MLTEEKLQNLLDDIRIGKYDNEHYTIECYNRILLLTDNDKQVTLTLDFYYREELDPKYFEDVKKYNKTWKLFRKQQPRTLDYHNEKKYYVVVNSSETEETYISEQLYNSFVSYITEIQEKDATVKRLNIQETFGL